MTADKLIVDMFDQSFRDVTEIRESQITWIRLTLAWNWNMKTDV